MIVSGGEAGSGGGWWQGWSLTPSRAASEGTMRTLLIGSV